MKTSTKLTCTLTAGLLVTLTGCSSSDSSDSSGNSASSSATSSSGSASQNVYAHTRPQDLSATAKQAKQLVYVPDTEANQVQVIDPKTYRVIRSFGVSQVAQHVVPSWDEKTLWVNESTGYHLTPIDPRTGKEGKPVKVDDPYNLYFSPDGSSAMVMAEQLRRIDFRDPHTMKLQHSLHVPCGGVNHADFTADLSTFVASCEFSGKLLVIPKDGSKVTKSIDLNARKTPRATAPDMARHMGGPAATLEKGASSMPQDVRLTPDGKYFLAADMMRNGIWVIDAKTFQISRFIHTGKGAHGIYPSRDATKLYVSNRDEGSVSVLDASTLKQTALWKIPGGGSPDMGGVTADGKELWLSGRYNSVVYVFDTTSGKVTHRIKVPAGPHGLAVWPQPGRFSLGHTGNMR